MKRYVLAGLGILFFGVVENVWAEMEVKVKDNTTNNGLSIKEETTGSTIARFRGDGNVGIGTTDPAYKLDVNGSLAVGNLNQNTNLHVRTNDVAYSTTIKNPTSPTTKAQSFLSYLVKDSLAVGDANQIRLGFFANNDVGGTPDTRFFSAIEAVVEDSNYSTRKAGLRFMTTPSGPWETERMRITGDGNVGIGTINPTTKLEINTSRDGDGILLGVDGNNENAWFTAKNPDRTWNFGIEGFRNDIFSIYDSTAEAATGNGHRFCIDANGNVGIGTTNPAYKLDVNGTIRGSNVSPSDMRWKEHVKTLDNSLEKVKNLRGVSFEWKNKAKGNGKQIGLIAQEVEAVFPEVVSEDNEGYKSVAYDKLVGVLVEAVKEQQRQIHELEVSNESLRQEISSIKEFVIAYAQPVTVPATSQIR